MFSAGRGGGVGPPAAGPAPEDGSALAGAGLSEGASASGGLRERATSSLGLDSNPYFSAGIGIMALGVALRLGQRGAILAAQLARRRLTVTMEITNKDPCYPWVLQYLSAVKRQRAGTRGRWWEERLARSHELAVETVQGEGEGRFYVVPGQGTHFFKFKGAWFQAKRDRTSSMDLSTGRPFETLILTALSKDRVLFPPLLAAARDLVEDEAEGKLVVFTAWGAEWRPFGRPRGRRGLETVVLQEGVKEGLVHDLEKFMARGQWYADRGIPYRRGYLLHGPPGSGKSTVIQALSSSLLGFNVCVLNLSERGLTDDKLNHLLANAPERSVVLLEDVDAAFRGREAGEAMRTNVTFSGLLNALDGITSAGGGRILFLTTNHLDRLDPALIRPGRVDLKVFLGDASVEQSLELWRRFYFLPSHVSPDTPATVTPEQPTPDPALEAAFRARLQSAQEEGTTISMAALQGHFIRCLEAQESVDKFGELEADAKAGARSREGEFSSSPH